MSRPTSGSGRTAQAVVAAALSLVAAAGCGTSSFPVAERATSADVGGGTSRDVTAPDPAPPARLAVSPVTDATNVSPLQPVVVRATGGTLSEVRVTNPAGKVVKGTLAADRLTWTSAEPLGYAKTYGVTAVAVNADGKPANLRSRFTTLAPATLTRPVFSYTRQGGVFGVGQPVVVHFDEPIPDKAAAERTLSVTTSPAVAGAWHWTSDREVHWRPPTYWTPGTKVTVSAKVYGVHFGEGLYGQESRSESFTIGSSKIAIVDDSTHMMQVFIDGRKVRNIPVSMGKGGQIHRGGRTIDFTTTSGVHVVTQKFPVKVMSSASFGLPEDDPQGYSTRVELAVRISSSGEYVHSAPWSVAAQGRRNVSHGCINISPEHARWFYDTFGPGDIVDVRGTVRKLGYTNGLGDWALPWNEWVKGSALN